GSWWSWTCLMTSGLRAKRSPGVRAHHGPACAPVRVRPPPPIVIDYHLLVWYMDGEQMGKLRLIQPPRKEPESEKITINLGYVDLGQVELLVQEGFYSNRTDFIRTAIRNQLGTHGDVLKQTVARRSMVLGLQRYSRQDLESVRAAGEQLHIQVLGLAMIDDDVPAQLAAHTI